MRKKSKTRNKPSLTARDRLLLLVVPGVVVLAVYSFFLNGPQIKALTKANAGLGKARQQAGDMPLNRPLMAGNVLRLQAEQVELQRRLGAFKGGVSDSLMGSQTVVLVGALLRQHGLTVVEEGPNSSSTAPNRRGGSNSQTGSAKPPESVWQIRFFGSWSATQTALAALPHLGRATCLPLSLTMAEPSLAQPTAREWTLRLRL